MSTTFDKREEGFERKFAFDQELQFKSGVRCSKLIGQWAAKEIGYEGEVAEAYAKEMVVADLEEPGCEDVFRKVRADFDKHGVKQSDHQIRRVMEELRIEAMRQIEAEN